MDVAGFDPDSIASSNLSKLLRTWGEIKMCACAQMRWTHGIDYFEKKNALTPFISVTPADAKWTIITILYPKHYWPRVWG